MATIRRASLDTDHRVATFAELPTIERIRANGVSITMYLKIVQDRRVLDKRAALQSVADLIHRIALLRGFRNEVDLPEIGYDAFRARIVQTITQISTTTVRHSLPNGVELIVHVQKTTSRTTEL